MGKGMQVVYDGSVFFFYKLSFGRGLIIREKWQLGVFFIEYPCRPIEDTVQVGQCHPVIGDRDARLGKRAETV